MMKRKKVYQEPKKSLLIVTSTEAEALYFSQMRKDCRYTNLIVQASKGAKDLEALIDETARARNAGKHDSAWALFGFDSFPVSWEQIRELQEYATRKRVKLAWNYPGLPLWYLLHIQNPRLPVESMTTVSDALKAHLPNFSPDSTYLLEDGNSLHLRLFPNKAHAALNAGSYNNLMAQRTGGLGATNMVRLHNEITEYCGIADVTHNQKLIGMRI